MNECLPVENLISILRKTYGRENQVGRSRILTFGSALTCSINYSRMLGGHKFFFGLAQDVPNRDFPFPTTQLGDFVMLVCGSEDKTLVLPRALILEALQGVQTRKLDVFVENGAYVMQTTQHPKLDVTEFLNAFPKPSKSPISEDELKADKVTPDRMHVKMQWALIHLGRAEGCSVWVPESDRGLSYRSKPFAEMTIEKLPNFGFDEYARRIVRNIDVLWLNRRVITKAFEIESTTSIYSGLLRLNDLVLAQPNNRIDLYIAAASQRRNSLQKQLLRPSFEHLRPQCQFTTFEALEQLAANLEKIPVDRGARVTGLIEGERFTQSQYAAYEIGS